MFCTHSSTFAQGVQHSEENVVPLAHEEPQSLSSLRFQLVAAHSGRCAEVQSSSTADGAIVQQWDCGSSTDIQRQWMLIHRGSNQYQIMSVNSGKCLDVKSSSTADGAVVQQYVCNNSNAVAPTNQLWTFVVSGNFLQIKPVHSGKCLDVSGAATTNGIGIIQWTCGTTSNNQLWKLLPITNITYQFEALNSYKCMEVQGAGTTAGTNVQQWSCGSMFTNHRVWQLTNLGDGVQLKPFHATSLCLDVLGQSPDNIKNDNNIGVWTCNSVGSLNQLWKLVPQGDALQLRALHSNKCATTKDVTEGANIFQYDCLGSAQWNQLWKMTPTDHAIRKTGQGFDICTLPTKEQMSSWANGPFDFIGIYTSGVNRACPMENYFANIDAQKAWL